MEDRTATPFEDVTAGDGVIADQSQNGVLGSAAKGSDARTRVVIPGARWTSSAKAGEQATWSRMLYSAAPTLAKTPGPEVRHVAPANPEPAEQSADTPTYAPGNVLTSEPPTPRPSREQLAEAERKHADDVTARDLAGRGFGSGRRGK